MFNALPFLQMFHRANFRVMFGCDARKVERGRVPPPPVPLMLGQPPSPLLIFKAEMPTAFESLHYGSTGSRLVTYLGIVQK